MKQSQIDTGEWPTLLNQIESISKPIEIVDKTFLGEIRIESIKTNELMFYNVTFEDSVWISQVVNSGLKIKFSKCNFSGLISFSRCKVNTIEFLHCKGHMFFLHNTTLNEQFSLYKTSFEDHHITDIESNSVALASNSNGKIRFDRLSCVKCEFDKNDDNYEIFINENTIPTLAASKIQYLEIELHSSFSGGIYIQSTEIESLKITGKLEKAVIDLVGNTYRNINIHHLVNGGTIKFSNVYFLPDSSLTISESDLGKAVLFGIDFNSISTFSITTANIGDIVSSGIRWCRHIDSATNNDMTIVQKREVYKQVKNILVRQNDKPEELRFYSLEMQCFLDQIKTDSSVGWNDKFILWFNHLTNNHGLSWTRPLALISATVFTIYFPIKWLLGFTVFDPSPKNIVICTSEMLECLNPIRKFTESFGLNGQMPMRWQSACARILDFIFLRLLVGLLLFQMVKAFRKYVK